MLTADIFKSAECEIIVGDPMVAGELRLVRRWCGDACRLSVVNNSPHAVRIAEAVAFRMKMPFSADIPFYGEGYNMLSQYKGTIGKPESITPHTDAGHYKLPQKPGFFTVYNLLMLFPQDDSVLLGFSSCHRFSGEFRFNAESLEVALDCEGLELAAGATLELEEFFFVSGRNREALFSAFAGRIQANHPRLPYPEVPTGWCSWYAYGPDVTEQDIFANLAEIKTRIPQLKFIQIDDGYQKNMGDWLQQHPNFPSPIRDLCLRIKSEGFEPAIWVAPFIADKDSDLLREHPEWFVKDEIGEPLPSNKYSFGGWRSAPWYMLDGTHPGAQDYLRHVFHTMREEWQCRYFKLDANLWGAMPFGHRHDPQATRVDAYRAGMRTVIEGAGEGSFILGCNAPMWPSIGTVHGMRVTGDTSRLWKTFRTLAEEGFNRNWQHGSLWINDPDCVVLNNLYETLIGPDGNQMRPETAITEDEFSFHAAYILASGGMVLSSDRMMDLTGKHLRVLGKLLPPGRKAAVFDDRTFRVGRIPTDDGFLLCLFNDTDTVRDASVPLSGLHDMRDFWTGQCVATRAARTPSINLAPHSARALQCTIDVRTVGAKDNPGSAKPAGPHKKMVISLDGYAAGLNLQGDSDWQFVSLAPSDFPNASGEPLKDWSNIMELRLGAKDTLRGKTTKEVGGDWQGPPPQFRNLRWLKNPLKS